MITAVAPFHKNLLNTIAYLIFLLLCCLVAYYPLTFHLFSLKNDALNYFLPVRHQISEALDTGIFPLWSPYFNLGYPLHGDMQSGVWNPVVQLFSLFGPYTLKTLQYETLLYIYLSGVGMFFLLNQFIADRKIILWASVAFMLCGFNSDSAQFLNWISAASFLPFVFLFYHRTLKERSWKQAVFCSFFLYLLFVTSYPADFIITAYVLFFYLIFHFVQQRKIFNKKIIINIIKTHTVILIFFLLLSLPAIISFSEFLNLSERGNGATYINAMSNPFHPLLLFSYVTPLGVWKAPFVSITDPLERNAYFGIITLILLIAAFFIRTNNMLIRFCKWAFFISLIFSFGAMGGLRALAYYLLPLMNTFRHPANAKIFTIFFACIVSALSLPYLIKSINDSKKKYAFYIVTTITIIILLIAIFTSSFTAFNFINTGNVNERIKSFLDNTSFADLILLNIFLQIPFLIITYFCFVKKINVKWLIIAGIINCIINTMLFQPFTVVKKDSVTAIQSFLNRTEVQGYPLPDVAQSLNENSKEGYNYFNEIGAGNMYNKKIGRIDYRITPSNLKTQNDFWFNKSLRNKLMQYPLLYPADTALHASDVKNFDTAITKKIIFIEDAITTNALNHYQRSTSNSIHVKSFTPNKFDFEIDCDQSAFYCLFQNCYPRWQLYIDGERTEIKKCNISFMGFQLPPGHHTVSFVYKKSDLIITFYISLIISLLIILFAMTLFIKSLSPS